MFAAPQQACSGRRIATCAGKLDEMPLFSDSSLLGGPQVAKPADKKEKEKQPSLDEVPLASEVRLED